MITSKSREIFSLSHWVVDEILEKYQNKSDFVQEAIIKLHLQKQNNHKLNKDNSSDSYTTRYKFSGFSLVAQNVQAGGVF